MYKKQEQKLMILAFIVAAIMFVSIIGRVLGN